MLRGGQASCGDLLAAPAGADGNRNGAERGGLESVADGNAASAEEASSRARRINEWVAVVAGILGVLVTVLGIFGINQSNARDEATATAEDLQGELDTANKAIGDLRSDNNKLQQDLSAAQADNEKSQAEIEALQQQLESTETSPPVGSSPSPSPSTSEPVRHSGEVTLAEHGDSIDLNAPSTNTTWENDNSGYDLARYRDGQLDLYSVDSCPWRGGSRTTLHAARVAAMQVAPRGQLSLILLLLTATDASD